MSIGTRASHENRSPSTAAFGRSRRRAILVVSAAALSVSSIARADKTWNGGGPTTDGGSWTTALNWVGGVAPTTNSGEVLTFDGFSKTSNIDNFAAGSGFGGIVFAPTAGAFTLTGNQIKLQGDVVDNTTLLTQNLNIPLLLDAQRNFNVGDGALLSIGGSISDTGGFGFNKIGNGTLTLTGTNTFAGPIMISAGVLSVSDTNQLGTAPASPTAGQLVLNGGTLRATASLTISPNRGIALGPSGAAGAGSLDVATGNTLTYQGIIANNTGGGVGTLNKYSYGTLILSGANTYSGATNLANGRLILNFGDAAAPATNIINPSSQLRIGGSTAGIGQESNASLIVTGKASTANRQSFAGTTLDLYGSVIQVTPGAGGTARLDLGALTHVTGASVVIPTNTGQITTTTGVSGTNGILGGFATAGTPGTARGITYGSDWATVGPDNGDGTRNITAYTGYVAAPAYNSADTNTLIHNNTIIAANADKNLQYVGTSSSTELRVDADNANSITDINTLAFSVNGANNTLTIGAGNTLRLGKFGGILKQNTGNNQLYIGGAGGVVSGNGSGPNIGVLTAGGPDIGGVNQPGEIVVSMPDANNNNGGMNILANIRDNGTAPVTFIKTGIMSIKIDGHNDFSGGLFINQGRFQLAGSEVNAPNPDGLGTGRVTVAPGGYLFVSGVNNTTAAPSVTFIGRGAIAGALLGSAQNAPILNDMTLSGNGTSQEAGGSIRLGGRAILSGAMTLAGDTRWCGGAGYAYPAINTDGTLYVDPGNEFSGKITGPGALDLGGRAVAGFNAVISNSNNDFNGQLQILPANNDARLRMGNNNVIPDGPGKGNLVFGDGTHGAVLDMEGHSDTINGLSSAPSTNLGGAFIENDGFKAVTIDDPNNAGQKIWQITANTSTLTLGNFDQTAAFGGTIRDFDPGNNVTLPDPNSPTGAIATATVSISNPSGNPTTGAPAKVAITKIGGGIQTLAGQNTYTGDTNISGGTLNVTGSLASTGAVKINPGGALAGTGNVGNVTQAPGSVISPGNNGLGSIGSITMSSLSSSNGSLSIDVGIGTTDTIQVTGSGMISGNLTLTAFGSASAGMYTILNTNSGLTLSGSPTFVAVPPPQTFGTRASSVSFVNPTTTPGQLKIVVTGGAKFLTWTGSTNANWDLTTTPNWVDDLGADKFFNGDIAIFQDNAPNRNINLVGTLSPVMVQFSNNGSNSYTLGGTGVLAGAMTLQKDGDATLTINSSNTYSGTTTFNNGTVIINGNNSTTGPMFINGGTVIYSAQTQQTGSVNLGSGTLELVNGGSIGSSSINVNGGNFVINRTDTSALSNVIGGGGGGEIDLTGTGTVTFSGANTYSASTKIQAGKLIVTNNNSLGTPPGGEVDISSGAALDLSGASASISFGGKSFHIQGAGPDGNGAIVNNGVTQQAAFQQVTLDNDATIGVFQRFDVRIAAGSKGDLNPQNHTLTKIGPAQFSVVNSDINDGNLDIKAGTVSFEGSTTSSGNGQITLEDGTAAQFSQLINEGSFNKPIQINGNVQLGTGGASNSFVNSTITFNGDLKIGLFSNNATLQLDGNLIEQNGPRNVLMTGNSSVTFDGQSVFYTGTTTISAGTLIIGNNDSNGSLGTGAVTNNGALVFNRGDTATYTAPISGTGGLYQTGSGTTTLSGNLTYTGGTNISSGTLIASKHLGGGALAINNGNVIVSQKTNNNDPTGVSVVSSVTISNGQLDITNNGLVVDYTGASPFAAVQQLVLNSYNNGSFNGNNGIASSTAATVNTNANAQVRAVGYAEASALGITTTGTFMGQTVDSTSVLVRYTMNGDANLDGVVNALDFNAVASNFGKTSGAVWSGGDFNFDGMVDTSDFTALSQNFNQALPAVAPVPALGTLVPEPGTLSLLAIGAGALMGRRRRR